MREMHKGVQVCTEERQSRQRGRYRQVIRVGVSWVRLELEEGCDEQSDKKMLIYSGESVKIYKNQK